MSIKKCRIIILTALALISFASALASVCIGNVRFDLGDVIRALFVDNESSARMLVFNLRLPRMLTGGLVGICLSLSGCILQGVMRNSLASPSTVGATSGAALVGYLTLAAFPAYSHLLPIGTIIGALITTLLIYILAYKKGASPLRMILSGMAVSAFFGALTDMIRTAFADSLANVSGFLAGGLNGVAWTDFHRILPFALVGILACAIIPMRMNILMLGDESASSLGIRTEPFRFMLIVTASLLAGAAVSVSGLIGFVGLIVPHIARILVGSDHRFLFPTASLLGFSLVVLCDTVGRLILPPGEIPVSVILALVGTPFFLWLLRTRKDGGA